METYEDFFDEKYIKEVRAYIESKQISKKELYKILEKYAIDDEEKAELINSIEAFLEYDYKN